MFGFDPKTFILNELRHLDIDHDGHPDVEPALEKIDTGVQALEKILSRLGEPEILALLHAGNNAIGRKFNEAEIEAAAAALASVPAALLQLDKVVKGAELALGEHK